MGGANALHYFPAPKSKIPVFTGMTAGKYRRCTQGHPKDKHQDPELIAM
jgi:hypothetical protein